MKNMEKLDYAEEEKKKTKRKIIFPLTPLLF